MKPCIFCGEDCAAKARVKDAQGRYACRTCAEARGAAAPQAIPLEPAAPALAPPPRKLCPACSHGMPAESVMCTNCGFDARRGFQPGSGVGTGPAGGGVLSCQACGYSMQGLRSPVCPECGAVVRRGTKRDRGREDSAAVVRREYAIPTIMFAAAVPATGLLLALTGRLGEVPGELLGLVLTIPAGLAAYWMLCAAALGFNAPQHLTALRLAGIYAVVGFASAVADLVPVPFLPSVLVFVLYMGLLMELLELEAMEAFLAAILTNVVAAVVGFGVGMMLG